MPPPSGSSSAFTSTDPFLVHALDLIRQGDFAEAKQSLVDPPKGSDQLAAAELLEIIDRIRSAYTLDDEAMLKKLRPSIADVTSDDLQTWRSTAQIQFREIDGQVRYFNREPANLFRFCPNAIARRKTQPAKSDSKWTLESHLLEVIKAAESQASPMAVPVHHRARYQLTVNPSAPGFRKNAMVSVWLPFPQEHDRQRDVKLIGASRADYVLAPKDSPQRTLYLQQRIEDPKAPLVFEENFVFTSLAYYPRLEDAQARPLPGDFPRDELSERPPHVHFTTQVRKTASDIVGSETNPLAAARKIFRFVTQSMRYCAEEEYCTIPSLSEKALMTLRGDCGVHAMLFITLCRASGIPARWQSGWQTKPHALDMHDWAEFYVAPWGWLPADPTYGAELKDHSDPEIRDFYFGHQDSYRLIVNSDYGAPLIPPKHSLRSEPLDFQRGEVEIEGRNVYFDGWDYDMRIER